jgi:hypothetical protein
MPNPKMNGDKLTTLLTIFQWICHYIMFCSIGLGSFIRQILILLSVMH